jgi:hypothetical protein
MAINVDTQDLVNYPGTVKRVTVDQEQVVPSGYEGDEQFMLSFSTTAYSDNTNRTQIQDLYVTHFKAGWCKSSGFAGSSGKFSLTASANTIGVKLDSTVSGTSGTGYYDIVLEYNGDGTPIDGEVVAADIEAKIRALADNLNTADIGFKLAYMNATVEYKGGRFWIVSGTVGQYYSGTNKTAVAVTAGSSNDASTVLGFDLSTTSEAMDGLAVKEALVTSGYTTGSGTMTISQNIGAADGDCLMITDNSNTDYFQLTSAPTGGTILSFSTSAINNSYSAGDAKVQLLRAQDPDADPTLWFGDVDKICRHGIKTMISQIDYSS